MRRTTPTALLATAVASAGDPVQPDGRVFVAAAWLERDGDDDPDEANNSVLGANQDLSCPAHSITLTPAGVKKGGGVPGGHPSALAPVGHAGPLPWTG